MELTDLRNVVLDTAPCIYFLEGSVSDRRRAVMEPLIEAAESGETQVSVSTLSVTELLTGPLRKKDRMAEARTRLFLSELCNLVPADFEVADAAARLRARHRLRTPDALVCATGLVIGADAIVGNDARWKRVADLPYVHLDDIAG